MLTYVVALALAASSGLVVRSPASAAPCDNPYTSGFASHPHINAPSPVERGERARIVVRVATDGNVEPTGRVVLTVVRSSGGFSWKQAKKYQGGKLRFRTPALKRAGKYVVAARFDADPAPCVHDSDARESFRVTRPD